MSPRRVLLVFAALLFAGLILRDPPPTWAIWPLLFWVTLAEFRRIGPQPRDNGEQS